MKRVLLCGLVVLVAADRAWAQKSLTLDEREASVGYINDLQGTDGGFRPSADDRVSQLGATVGALRGLKYLGGRPRNREGVTRFVKRCYDEKTGSFTDVPGGKTDVRPTAMGLMASVELELSLDEIKGPVEAYFAKNASRSLGDTYIAAAALHPAGIPASKAKDWIAAFEATRNSDGSYGKSVADTASAVVTILRLGGQVKDRDRVLEVLRSAQRSDGGFSTTGERSDLRTTYPVMRAFYMLREKPDLARCREFISKCRNADGGYGATPGQPSTVSTTYLACIIMHWIDELDGE